MKRNSLIGKMIRPFYLVNIGFLVYNIKQKGDFVVSNTRAVSDLVK